MSQPDRPSPYAVFAVPPRRRRRPTPGLLILAAGVLLAAAIIIGAIASSTPPPTEPIETGPGPTTQVGVIAPLTLTTPDRVTTHG